MNYTKYRYSITITDQTGDIKENRSGVYAERCRSNAWGRPRDPNNWSYNIGMAFGGAGEGITMRGYTMHEHLEMFSLINMNGRLYDPVLGRMLSPDNYIQAPDNTQSFNRYSYCVNNPLKYTDPSGDLAFLAVVGIVAAVTGTMNLVANRQNVKSFGDGLYYFGVGALVGAAATVGGSALAPVIGTGAIAGATMGAGSGFIMEYANAGYRTGDWGYTALEYGGKGALYGAVGGAIIGGAVSGVRGNNIWTGAKPTAGSSVFSFGDVAGAKGSPSWNFSKIQNIGTKNFWKYGKNFKVYPEKISKGTFPRMEVDDLINKVEWKDVGNGREMNGFIKGNYDQIYESLTRGGGELKPSGAFLLDNGIFLKKAISSDGLNSIY